MKNVFLFIGLMVSINVMADCSFSESAASRAFLDGWQSGERGYVTGCSMINAMGVHACAEFFRDNNGEACSPNSNMAQDSQVTGIGDLSWSYHPGYYPGSTIGINYNSPVPPPGWYMAYHEWDQMRQSMIGDKFGSY